MLASTTTEKQGCSQFLAQEKNSINPNVLQTKSQTDFSSSFGQQRAGLTGGLNFGYFSLEQYNAMSASHPFLLWTPQRPKAYLNKNVNLLHTWPPVYTLLSSLFASC